MAYASKNLGTPNPYSSYTAYQNAAGDKWTSTPSTGELTYYVSFADLGIPDGSTVNSASITWTWGSGGSLHGTALQGITVNGTAYTGGSSYSGMAVSAGANNTLIFRYKSGTSNTSYPAKPATSGVTNSKTNAGYIYFENATLHVYYTLPYTACTPPTWVSTPNNVLPNTNYTLSWGGAGGGTNNAISGYGIYRASTENGNYTYIGWTASTSATVTSHATNGYSYYYKIATGGSVTGYDSGLSSATATMTSLITSATAPTAISVSANNVAPNVNVTLSWSEAGGGTNNTIVGYHIYRSITSGGTYTHTYSVTTTAASSSVTVASNADPNTSYFYRVYTLGSQGYNSGPSGIVELKTTVSDAVSPSTVSVPSATAAPSSSVTLSWSGAAAGTNNAITGYEIYQSTAAGGTYTLYGSKINTAATSGSATVVTHSTPNSSYYYKVKTIGTISGFNAANPSTVYAGITSTVTAAAAPTSFSGSPTLYEGAITLTWSGQAGGTNNPITSYNIEYQVSNDGSTWGAATSTTATTASKEINTSAVAAGAYLRFRVQSKGTIAGYDSGWSAYSSSYRKNRKPLAPTIVYPVTATTTYNTTPYIKVVVAAEPDGQTQTLQYKINSGSYVNATVVPASGGTFIFQTSALTAGSKTVAIRIVDATGGISSEESRDITVVTTPYTDNTLTTSTPIKAAHINEIRSRIDNMLAYFGLPAVTWTDTITAGVTPIKAQHMIELQNTLKSCAIAAGTTRSFSTIVRNVRIAKIHIEQLRVAITQL